MWCLIEQAIVVREQNARNLESRKEASGNAVKKGNRDGRFQNIALRYAALRS